MRILNYLLIALLLLGGLGWVSGKLEIKWVDKEEPKTAEKKIPIDYGKLSAEELLPLAEKGEANIQIALGAIYYRGDGVPKDYQEAAKWFKLAAEQGDAGAQYRLGNMYRNYDDVQDYQLAFKWLSKAAKQGHAKSQWFLGKMYHYGEGIPKDYVLAHKWYNLAAAQKEKDAPQARDFLAKRMTPSQIKKAQRLAAEFKPKKENP